jgi:hypothetical protein
MSGLREQAQLAVGALAKRAEKLAATAGIRQQRVDFQAFCERELEVLAEAGADLEPLVAAERVSENWVHFGDAALVIRREIKAIAAEIASTTEVLNENLRALRRNTELSPGEITARQSAADGKARSLAQRIEAVTSKISHLGLEQAKA